VTRLAIDERGSLGQRSASMLPELVWLLLPVMLPPVVFGATGRVAAYLLFVPVLIFDLVIGRHVVAKWKWAKSHPGGFLDLDGADLVISQPGLLRSPVRLTPADVALVALDLSPVDPAGKTALTRRGWSGVLKPPKKGHWALVHSLPQIPNLLIVFDEERRIPEARWRHPPEPLSLDYGLEVLVWPHAPKPLPVHILGRGAVHGLFLRLENGPGALDVFTDWCSQTRHYRDGYFQFVPPGNDPPSWLTPGSP
jgi:hypothetical protein